MKHEISALVRDTHLSAKPFADEFYSSGLSDSLVSSMPQLAAQCGLKTENGLKLQFRSTCPGSGIDHHALAFAARSAIQRAS